MEKVMQKFPSHRQSEEADRAYYQSLSPQERLEILLKLIAQGQPDETEQRLTRVYRIVKLHGR